jgi:hypothetical protein
VSVLTIDTPSGASFGVILLWVFTETSGGGRNWRGSSARTQATLLQAWTDNGPGDGAGNRRLSAPCSVNATGSLRHPP